jgi:hypothetical protein
MLVCFGPNQSFGELASSAPTKDQNRVCSPDPNHRDYCSPARDQRSPSAPFEEGRKLIMEWLNSDHADCGWASSPDGFEIVTNCSETPNDRLYIRTISCTFRGSSLAPIEIRVACYLGNVPTHFTPLECARDNQVEISFIHSTQYIPYGSPRPTIDLSEPGPSKPGQPGPSGRGGN